MGNLTLQWKLNYIPEISCNFIKLILTFERNLHGPWERDVKNQSMIVCSFEELVLFSMIIKIRTTRRLQVEISSKLSIFKCKKYPWSRFLGRRKKKRKIEEKKEDRRKTYWHSLTLPWIYDLSGRVYRVRLYLYRVYIYRGGHPCHDSRYWVTA